MATAQRVKGQEVSVIVVRGGVTEDTLTDIHSCNVEFESEIKSAGYLGEKTNRKDDIFNGVKFDFEFHSHTQDWLRFLVAVHDRQKRNNPGLVINVAVDLLYPNLDNPTIFLPDGKFGGLPTAIASRSDYVNKKVQGECEDYDIQFS